MFLKPSRLLVFAIIAVSSLGCAIFTPKDDAITTTLVDTCEKAIRSLTELHNQPIPEHFTPNILEAIRNGSEFDPNLYFAQLTHLSMQPETTLDYVYQYDFIGGYPILYTRPTNQPRYPTRSSLPQDALPPWQEAIQTDDTPLGFLELATLYLQGGQFYLHWHANYFDTQTLCNQEDITAILDTSDFGQEIPADVQRNARKLDPAPKVTMQSNQVTVTLTTFTKWGGFMRKTLTFQRTFPHKLLDSTSETIVPYDCGILF